MKHDIHPKYFDTVEIRCSCGNIIISGSTKDKLKTELCSKCHPFYTGQQKLVDTAGRVDKFEAKRKKSFELKEQTVRRSEAKKAKPEEYKEKEVPMEIIEKSTGLKKEGKWGAPIGDAPAQMDAPTLRRGSNTVASPRLGLEVVKEEISKAKVKPVKKAKAQTVTAKKAAAKKPSAKKTSAKKKSVKKA